MTSIYAGKQSALCSVDLSTAGDKFSREPETDHMYLPNGPITLIAWRKYMFCRRRIVVGLKHRVIHGLYGSAVSNGGIRIHTYSKHACSSAFGHAPLKACPDSNFCGLEIVGILTSTVCSETQLDVLDVSRRGIFQMDRLL